MYILYVSVWINKDEREPRCLLLCPSYIYIVCPSWGMMATTSHIYVCGKTVQSWHWTASRNQDIEKQGCVGRQVLLLHVFFLSVSLWRISSASLHIGQQSQHPLSLSYARLLCPWWYFPMKWCWFRRTSGPLQICPYISSGGHYDVYRKLQKIFLDNLLSFILTRWPNHLGWFVWDTRHLILAHWSIVNLSCHLIPMMLRS